MGARLSRLAVVVAVAAVLGVGAAAGDVAQGEECTPRATASYSGRVAASLRSGRDVWGGQLLAARDGPTLERAARYLAPLTYGRTVGGRFTRSGVAYLPFAMPGNDRGASAAMLHVLDGGEILARRVTGPSLGVFVGAGGRERYGSCLARLSESRLANGWLPILLTRYRDADGVGYAQESFAMRSRGTLSAYVRVTAASGPATLRIGGLSVDVPRGAARTLHARWTAGREVAIDAEAYGAARRSVEASWRSRLTGRSRIEVPEEAVQDAMNALVAQGLTLTWRYSYGNPYEQVSFPEVIDVARTLGELGLRDVARAMLARALPARPTPYPNWKMGSKLLGYGAHYRLFRDRNALASATPTLRGFVDTLARQQQPSGLLPAERFSSDIPDEVYGLHAQATIWQGLREIADAWAQIGRDDLASRARALAGRLERGLRAAVRRSARSLPDGSTFLPMRLLENRAPYGRLTESREASYWNLVAPYALGSGLFAPGSREARGSLRYVDLHGGRLLGLVRSGVYVLYGPDAGGARSGVNPVYGNSMSRFLADLDRPDRLVLALYGQLAAGMSPQTYVGGEGTTVAPLDGVLLRSTYRPPNAAANATFLTTLRLLLVHDTARGLDLAFSTPRGWLEPGKRISVRGAPTRFGPVSYSVTAKPRVLRVRVVIPSRTSPGRLRLRLRLPAGERIGRITPARPVDRATQTIDLSGLRGTVELAVQRLR
jgi:hypothetical protein